MGRPVARLGNPVQNDADAHGSPSGPVIVPVVGIITEASNDTFANMIGVAVADPSKKFTHSACAATQTFSLESDQHSVFCNGFPVVRSGDPTDHCGSNPLMGGTKGKVLPYASLDVYA